MTRTPFALGLAVCIGFGALANPIYASAQDRPLTAITDVKRGTMVTVAGTVDRLLDEDEFRLRDDTGTLRVYVGPNWVPADIGEAVTVFGYMDDALIRPELYAREITRADGTVVTLSQRYD
ncbi:hypothetical protein ACG74X_05615 [Marivita sp. S0852]|uniref:hypothetical protein n=1 Tax=Marivita sp. S0852 TaxID=3373893 RepID=UPI003981E3C8